MAIADDFAVSAAGDITYVGAAHGAAGAGYYTTIQFHRWLQDIADDATPATANDLLDITSATPSDRKTDNYIVLINGYNIDDTVSEHLFDGSIEQLGGNTIYDGLVVIAGEGMDLQIIQNGAQVANDFWNSIPNGLSTKGLNRDAANGISHRFMIKVRDAAEDTDGRRFIGVTRVDYQSQGGTNGKTFSEFKVNGSARGNNVLALTYADDLNDTADASTYVGFANTEGYREIDVDVDGATEPYYSEWDLGANSIGQLYQYTKYLSRGAAANSGTLYGIDAKIFRGITHELTINSGVGDWVEPESLSWSGGTGQLLAVDNTASGSATKLWMQILTGVAPSSGTITGNGGATATVSAQIERPVSTPYSGVSTGSALIGAFGFGIQATDLQPSDLVTNLTGGTKSPPLNVTIAVGGVVSGEDYILVGPSTGSSALQKNQFALDAGITAGAGSITLSAGQETPGTGTKAEKDTPAAGTIRVQDNSGVFQRVSYTGVTHGSGTITFTGCAGAPTADAANETFISYIDALYNGTTTTDRFTAQYFGSKPAGDRSLFVRVRDGGTAGDAQGIKTFEVETNRSNATASVTAIRTADV
jgi:hypothetical protein